MELPVDHFKHAMARDKWLRASGATHAVKFAMEVVMGADLGSAIIALQSESSPG
jgi:hypothetical protein